MIIKMKSRSILTMGFAPFFLILWISILLFGCSNDKLAENRPRPDPTGELVEYSGCIGFETQKPDIGMAVWDNCMEYSYDGNGFLSLLHTGASFNCCILEVISEIEIDDHNITISERDVLNNGGCDCHCPYDLNYEIRDLAPGEYTISCRAVEYPYYPVLEFTVTLPPEPISGSYCVEGSHGMINPPKFID